MIYKQFNRFLNLKLLEDYKILQQGYILKFLSIDTKVTRKNSCIQQNLHTIIQKMRLSITNLLGLIEDIIFIYYLKKKPVIILSLAWLKNQLKS